jgi:hypothetical protein
VIVIEIMNDGRGQPKVGSGIDDVICRSWPDAILGIIEKFDTCRTL